MLPRTKPVPRWGSPPWIIDFFPCPPSSLPQQVDFAIVGAGFHRPRGCRLAAPARSGKIRRGPRSGRASVTARAAAPAAWRLRKPRRAIFRVWATFSRACETFFAQLDVDCDLALPGAWEIGRKGGLPDSPISWNDSGTLRVVDEVPGGTLDPGKLVSGLARAAQRRGAVDSREPPRARRSMERARRVEVRAGWPAARQPEISRGQNSLRHQRASLELSGLDRRHDPQADARRAAPRRSATSRSTPSGSPRANPSTPWIFLICGDARRRTTPSCGARAWSIRRLPGTWRESTIRCSGSPPRCSQSSRKRVRGLHPALASLDSPTTGAARSCFAMTGCEPVFDRHPQSRNAHRPRRLCRAWRGALVLSGRMGRGNPSRTP